MQTSYILFSGITGQDRENICIFTNKKDVINAGYSMIKYSCRDLLKNHPDFHIKITSDKSGYDNESYFELYNKQGKFMSDKYQCQLGIEPIVTSPNNKELKHLTNQRFPFFYDPDVNY